MKPQKIASFVSFALMFVGAGFISGSIVHFGEGVTTWDVGVLCIGVAMFVIGSYWQEKIRTDQSLTGGKLGAFLLLSLFLSIGIGMASGGFQHYIDTPLYSAKLIPIGIFIGYIAYMIRENGFLSKKNSFTQTIILLPVCIVIFFGLSFINTLIPESLRAGHGSHGGHHHGGGHYSVEAGTQGEVEVIENTIENKSSTGVLQEVESTIDHENNHVHDDSHNH